jgi:hypothetical protein
MVKSIAISITGRITVDVHVPPTRVARMTRNNKANSDQSRIADKVEPTL